MVESASQRRLAAILVADVVGYSRLMEADEAGTLAALKERRRTVLEPVVKAHGGRIVKVMGDGVLIEFASAVNAVQGAIELQEQMAVANEGIEDVRRIDLRIGINLGDVIGEGSDIYGEGVNIAARLESLAAPGGICISAKIHEEVKGKIKAGIEDMGAQTLKNIASPVGAFRIVHIPRSVAPATISTRVEKPSIAVLPLDNMSGDPGQVYFADGISENLITDLSRFRDLTVIARNSSFAYRGKATNISQISRELGASYVLEGSVQRVGDRVRVTVQLIEGATGKHLWADRYDRQIEDIFAVQDEITETIVGTLATSYGGRLQKAWQARPGAGGARNFQAFDHFLRAQEAFLTFTEEDTRRARELFQEAVRLDPAYAKAHAKTAWTHLVDVNFGWSKSPKESFAQALASANAAIAADDDEAWGHWAMAGCYLFQGQQKRALVEFERALALNPNDADVITDIAYCLSYSGRTDEALEFAHKAMRLNPHYPEWYLMQLGPIYFNARQYTKAVETLNRIRTMDTASIQLHLAASQAAMGHQEPARRAVERALELDPSATISRWASPESVPYQREEDREHFEVNLRKAGLPQ
ncbi:MAG: adenylate/guanylate cyclase domain-containing protein [Hyphomicrobiales bacterium]